MTQSQEQQKKPPVSISQYCGIDVQAFEETGAFDAFLNHDSGLFIDPHLLTSTDVEEFLDAYSEISKRFNDILLLLSQSDEVDDLFWKEAEKLLTFSEVKGLCIGYAEDSTSGSGIGKKLRTRMLETAKKIIKVGICDPRIFELMSLFQEGIGTDRISDMIAGILQERFYRYSHRIFSNFNLKYTVEMVQKTIGKTTYKLPQNPYNKQPIMLIPKNLLHSFPMDRKKSKELNTKIRDYMSRVVGNEWKNIVCSKKRRLDDGLLKHPDLLQQVLEEYSQKPAISYDFKTDPEGQFKFHSDARQYISSYPLELLSPTSDKPEKVMSISLEICKHFKRLVENNGANAFFYSDQDKPRKEKVSQLFFFCIADLYCQVNDLDLSPEVNSGRGCVDFKISSGYKSRVLIEIKLTTNTNLLTGYKHQLSEYQKAESTIYAIYLVIHVKGGSQKNFESLKELSQEKSFRNKQGSLSQLKFIFVDAVPKASASHFKP